MEVDHLSLVHPGLSPLRQQLADLIESVLQSGIETQDHTHEITQKLTEICPPDSPSQHIQQMLYDL